LVRAAVIDLHQANNPRTYGYGELDRLSSGVARFLRARGYPSGSSVGLLGQNSFRYLACYFGILRAGLVAVPINYKLPGGAIEFIVQDAGIVAMFADAAEGVARAQISDTFDMFDPALELGAEVPVGLVLTPEQREAALVLYTSGSTGRPKGVVLSHDSQWAIIEGMGASAEPFRDKRAFVAAPLFHMNGLVFSEIVLKQRGTLVLLPRFRAADAIRAISRYEVNVVTGVPTMLALMAREVDLLKTSDFASVELVWIGSAPLSDTLVTQVHDMFPRAVVINGYGTTEAGAGIFGAHPDGLPQPKMSIGYPAQNVEMRLVGGSTRDQGVLEVRGPMTMTKYHNLPEMTREKLVDGWVNTGDIMSRDSNGFFYFVGRADDLIVCGAEKIYPGEVERILERHPGVLEACVVGVPDDVRGFIPVAFIVRRAAESLTEQNIKDYVLSHAPPYSHPRHVFFLDSMPLAGTNKIDRRLLAKRAADLASSHPLA
jgi:acyl-CoA synthetase (AMP-forming)/AMP-acid ligase II